MKRISLKRLLREGRYDSLVTGLSNRMLQTIKDSYSAVTNPRGEFGGGKIYFKADEDVPRIDGDEYGHIYFEEIENEKIPLDFYIALRVQWIEGLDDYRKGGDAYNEEGLESDEVPYIEIRFELDPNDVPNIYSEIAMDLRDTIRHEIEHLTQTGWNVKQGKFLPSDQKIRKKIETGKLPAYKYFTLDTEIPAMIQGLYYKAKKSRKPFKDVVNSYLDNFLYMKDTNGTPYITPEDKEKIIATWRKELPKLAIRQEL
jgi:hypothetical protein